MTIAVAQPQLKALTAVDLPGSCKSRLTTCSSSEGRARLSRRSQEAWHSEVSPPPDSAQVHGQLVTADTTMELQISDDRSNRIDNGEMCFLDANKPLDCENQKQDYCALTDCTNLPWQDDHPELPQNERMERIFALNAQKDERELMSGKCSQEARKKAPVLRGDQSESALGEQINHARFEPRPAHTSRDLAGEI
jgi:hypothetical protein